MKTMTDGRHKGLFFEAINQKFNKCLCPDMGCEKPAIRAHSVQKSTALSFIEEDKHVYGLKINFAGAKPVCEFERVGRNNASTFTGFCNRHDTEIFRPIDTKLLDLENAEQLFLIAYRSLTRELHAILEGAAKLQFTHETNVKLGLVNPNDRTMSAIAPVEAMHKAWMTWRYRLDHYDTNMLKGRFGEITHSIFVISDRAAVLASSSFFPTIENPKDNKMPRIALNMIPLSGSETAVIFSYPKAQSANARKYIAPVMLKRGEERLLALSTLALDTTENFFLRPSHVDSWSAEKKNLIQESYFSTVTKGAFLKAQPEYMLF
ncbi:hypothetical protein GGQ73_002946 [Rhizobium skierniewicense]|uniref:DUF4238 domain-containing protein n=1 Tax=Rhizobium skierniewicense TaxID=984260 RepID=A0A7W6CBX1_9HYPH|nr:hypothetical protein [Rhizobium skierniewicense]MBB3946982.1 hypothetical protein [Rhizobium skierniewicense]